MNVYLFFESYNYGIRLGHFKPVPKSFPCLGWFPSAAVEGRHVAGAASEYSEAGSNCGCPGRISVTNFLHSYTPRQIATCTLNLNSVYLESRLYMQHNWINLCFHNMIIYIYMSASQQIRPERPQGLMWHAYNYIERLRLQPPLDKPSSQSCKSLFKSLVRWWQTQ